MGQAACCVPQQHISNNRVHPKQHEDDSTHHLLNKPKPIKNQTTTGLLEPFNNSKEGHQQPTLLTTTSSSSSLTLLNNANGNLPNSNSQYITLQQNNQDQVGLENVLVMINSEQLLLLQQLIQRGPPQEVGVQTETPDELTRLVGSRKSMTHSTFKDEIAIGTLTASASSSSGLEENDYPHVRTSKSFNKNSSKKLRRKRSNASSGAHKSFSKDRSFGSDNGQDAEDRTSIVNSSPKRSFKNVASVMDDDQPEQEDVGKEDKEIEGIVNEEQSKLILPTGLSPYSDEEGYNSSGPISNGGSETEGSSPRTKREVHVTTTVSTGFDRDGKKTVNEYVVIKKIGRGMHGKVKLCQKSDTGELCALKIINRSVFKDMKKKDKLGRPIKDKDNSSLMTLMKEVSILKKVHHSNVVELYEVIDDPTVDKLFLIFEYIESGCLMKILTKDKTDRPAFSEDVCRRYFRDLIGGLEYLHENKIVHRDIKPENVLVTKDDRLKITDFGVSSMLEGDNDSFNTAPGTPAFLSPEACHVGSYNGYISDIWAVGVTLFVMLYGKLPFFGPGILGMYHSILNDAPEIPENIGDHLANLLTRIFCKDPHKRITIKEIKEHPWVTLDGKWPFITQVDKIGVSTDQEIAIAITIGREMKVLDRFMLFSKMKAKFGMKARKAKDAVRQRNEALPEGVS